MYTYIYIYIYIYMWAPEAKWLILHTLTPKLVCGDKVVLIFEKTNIYIYIYILDTCWIYWIYCNYIEDTLPPVKWINQTKRTHKGRHRVKFNILISYWIEKSRLWRKTWFYQFCHWHFVGNMCRRCRSRFWG